MREDITEVEKSLKHLIGLVIKQKQRCDFLCFEEMRLYIDNGFADDPLEMIPELIGLPTDILRSVTWEKLQ